MKRDPAKPYESDAGYIPINPAAEKFNKQYLKELREKEKKQSKKQSSK